MQQAVERSIPKLLDASIYLCSWADNVPNFRSSMPFQKKSLSGFSTFNLIG